MKKIILIVAIISLLIVGFFSIKRSSLKGVDDINSSSKQKLISNTKVDRNITKDNLVVSIHGKDITKDDLPKEYSELNYRQKKKFLSRYIYLKVVLDRLEDKQREYKGEIEKAIEKEKNRLKRLGVEINPLEELLLKMDASFNTIAFNEVLKKHKNIDREIEEFYKKSEKNFNMPDSLEISHISLKDKNRAEKILKELIDKNATIEIFAKYVKEYSRDYRTVAEGGYVGKVDKKGIGDKFFKEMWDSNISKGIYPKLLEQKNYYHILYIIDKIPAYKKTLSEERDNIEKFILRREIRKWRVEHFRESDKNSNVKVYDIKVNF